MDYVKIIVETENKDSDRLCQNRCGDGEQGYRWIMLKLVWRWRTRIAIDYVKIGVEMENKDSDRLCQNRG